MRQRGRVVGLLRRRNARAGLCLVRIEGRVGDHGQHGAGRRIEHDDGAILVGRTPVWRRFQGVHGGRLQDRIDGKRDVVRLGWRLIEEKLAEVLRALCVGLEILVVGILNTRGAVVERVVPGDAGVERTLRDTPCV